MAERTCKKPATGVFCTHCATHALDVQYQPCERRTENGVWVDEGGFYIATCRNGACSKMNRTVEISKHPFLD